MTIELFKVEKSSYYWRAKASNGETICHSEIYTTKAKAMKTIKLLTSTTKWKVKVNGALL